MTAEKPSERQRPLRADARRNYERVLDAARAAFTDEGPSVPVDEIARRANVGPGTVHRHFPTKEALMGSVLVENLMHNTERAWKLLEGDDPEHAFEAFFYWVTEHCSRDRVLAEALERAGAWDSVETALASENFIWAIENLLSRAQAAGLVRGDVTAKQAKALMVGVSKAAELAGDVPATRKHLASVVYEGLRARP